jgi:dimethylhistidine N-methyltransferase
MNSDAQKITDLTLGVENEMACEVLDGLLQSPKQIAPKYFYDQRGSALFDAITKLDEYYIPRVEKEIFGRNKEEICEEIGEAKTIVEPGAGSCEKIKWLLPELNPATYIPMDISRSHLQKNARNLSLAYPDLIVSPLVCDHTNDLTLGNTLPEIDSVFFYPGSSIGNFEPKYAVYFMRKLRMKMGSTGGLLIGVDTKKPLDILHAAYNDSKRVTAAFNINVLHHLNTLFDGTLSPDAFEHVAFYNQDFGRIEMHLRCIRDHTASLAGTIVKFRAGELINTEHSYKYHPDEFSALAHHAGLRLKHLWQDKRHYFSVMYFVPACFVCGD